MKNKMCLIITVLFLAIASTAYANKEGDRGFGRGISGGGQMSPGFNRGGGRVSNSTAHSRWSPTAKDKARDKRAQNFKREVAEWVFFPLFKGWGVVFQGAEKAHAALKKEAAKTKKWQNKQREWPSNRGMFGYSGSISIFNPKNNDR